MKTYDHHHEQEKYKKILLKRKKVLKNINFYDVEDLEGGSCFQF